MNKKIAYVSLIALSAFMITNIGMTKDLTQKIDVIFNTIKLQINGQAVEADNLLYNGTTYVPLRKVSELFDKDLHWDATTNTANIADKTQLTEPKVEKDEELKIVENVKTYKTFNFTSYVRKADKNYKIYTSLDLVRDNDGNLYSNLSGFIVLHKIAMNDYTLGESTLGLIDRQYEKFFAIETYFSAAKVRNEHYTFYNDDRSKKYEVILSPELNSGVVMVKGIPLVPLSEYMKTIGVSWGITISEKDRTIIHHL